MTIYPTAKICDRTKRTMGRDTTIGDFSFICSNELVMEDGSMIARFVEVSGRGKVHLKEGAVIASHCSVLTSTDRTDAKMNDASPEEERNILTADVTIGRYAFVGNHCVIMPGVTIGDWAVVGAGSYIDKDVPPHTVIRPRQELVAKARVIRSERMIRTTSAGEDHNGL